MKLVAIIPDQEFVKKFGCDYEQLIKSANEALSHKFIGENPNNDQGPREKKLLVAANVLRQDIIDIMDSYHMGHLSMFGAYDIISTINTALKLLVECQ